MSHLDAHVVGMRRTASFVLVVFLAGCGSSAGRAPNTGKEAAAATVATNNRGVAVTFTVTGPPIAPGAPACATSCPLPYTQTGTADGWFQGVVAGVGAVKLAAPRF